jgi:hypothetical protein
MVIAIVGAITIDVATLLTLTLLLPLQSPLLSHLP